MVLWWLLSAHICLGLDVLCGVFCGAHVFHDFLYAVLEMIFGSSNDVPNFGCLDLCLLYCLFCSPFMGAKLALWAVSLIDATWLILPVVICLSQRLSHACVSMN